MSIENSVLYESIYNNLVETLRAMVNAIEARDKYTRSHSQRVTALAMDIGREMGRPEEEIETIKLAGSLHDIGKVGIRDSILLKRGALSKEEFDVILCSEVVEHLPIINVFLGECSRVLKKGGLLLLTTDNPTYIKNRLRFLLGKADFLAHAPHLHLYTPAKLKELLEAQGFNVLKAKNIGNFFKASWGDVYLMVAKKR